MFHSRLEMAERISELEESSIESIESEEEKKEWRKMNLRPMDNIKLSNVCVIRTPKRERSRKNIVWQKNKKEEIIG